MAIVSRTERKRIKVEERLRRYEHFIFELGTGEFCEERFLDEGGMNPPSCQRVNHGCTGKGDFCKEALDARERYLCGLIDADVLKRRRQGGLEPRVVCLCGSTKFEYAFERAAKEETLAGNIVLSAGVFIHQYDEFGSEKHDVSEDVKNRLDELHMAKIRMADEILVLNVGGYIGDSTRREVDYAKELGKTIRWLTEMTLKDEYEERAKVEREAHQLGLNFEREGLSPVHVDQAADDGTEGA